VLEHALADPVALGWVAVAAILAVVSALGVSNAINDVRSMRGLINGRRTFAFDGLRWQAAMLAVGLIWLAVGAEVLFHERVVQLTFGSVGLIVGNVVLTVASVLSRRARQRLLEER
jgi:hypothetical protein